MRHFRLTTAIGRLASGMPQATFQCALIPSLGASQRFRSCLLRTAVVTIDIATIAVAAQYNQLTAPQAVELTRAICERVDASGRVAKNWTSPTPRVILTPLSFLLPCKAISEGREPLTLGLFLWLEVA